jgi:hypothetical protein
MKKLMMLFAAAALTFAASSVASAQTTASGTLTVNAKVTDSLQLVFNTDGSGVALTSGAGTSTATLDFGSISAFGPLSSPKITRSVNGTTSFTVSTPVDVQVTSSNSTSANYKLTAQLGSVDATNNWTVGGVAVTNGSAALITSTGTYGANTAEAIAITVPFTTASGTAISNTINFTATAN